MILFLISFRHRDPRLKSINKITNLVFLIQKDIAGIPWWVENSQFWGVNTVRNPTENCELVILLNISLHCTVHCLEPGV